MLQTSCLHAFCQQKQYYTKQITAQVPVVDGKITEKVWESVSWGEGFLQWQPKNGDLPEFPTYFKILYDDNSLYLALRMVDSIPDQIDKRMSKRDDYFNHDFICVEIDSYNDDQTSFNFIATPAGVRSDEIALNDGFGFDFDWNANWYLKTHIDSLGWSAEFKIPFNQLRFSNEEEQIWGIQFTRKIYRIDEISNWVHVPLQSSRWVSMFGELRGIKGIKPRTQKDITPFVAGKFESFEKVEDNPFRTGRSFGGDFGVDAKLGISNDLTLDLTINPDFGQVEADPSEVNLSAYETFFQEKRPFFIEGNKITDFKIAPSYSGTQALDNLFYSRRIGKSPTGIPITPYYYDKPINTTILGAAKLTGKNKKGLSVGIIESLTAKEIAEIAEPDGIKEEVVEPLTNYLVGSIQKENENNGYGGMFTSVNRFINDSSVNFLNSDAFSGGINYYQYFFNRKYYFDYRAFGSYINGSADAILKLQKSPARYYQRPDVNYVKLDSATTSLTGFGSTLALGKQSLSGLKYDIFFSVLSPGLELNDAGYLYQSDIISEGLALSYSKDEPGKLFRKYRLNAEQWVQWNFGGQMSSTGLGGGMYFTFHNLWGIGASVSSTFNHLCPYILRGGPAFKYPGFQFYNLFAHSDERKKLYLHLSYTKHKGNQNIFNSYSLKGTIRYRPFNSFSISIIPSFVNNNKVLQYVNSLQQKKFVRYILGTIEQKTASLTLRLDYYITPDLSIQYYGQPFVSSGKYKDFKKVIDPKAENFYDRIHVFNKEEISYDNEKGTYEVDENMDGKIDYTFSNPDYNFRQFRSNLIIRWEFRPGSTLYLVWNQGITGTSKLDNFNILDEFSELFELTPHNIFLLKFSYRFSI